MYTNVIEATLHIDCKNTLFAKTQSLTLCTTEG